MNVYCTVYCIPDGNSPSRLGIMPRPRGADWLTDEIASLRDQKVDVVISLLISGEEEALQLTSERDQCQAAGLRFLSFPIPDRQIPENPQAARQFFALVNELYAKGVRSSFTAGRGSAEPP